MKQPTDAQFKKTIWRYYRAQSRTMPWRRTRNPYRILISEVMLQQTQVSRVLNFYEKFIKQFSNFRVLARAKTRDVLFAWQGLGYNRRALALHNAAKKVAEEYGGRLPRDAGSLTGLPGIGPYTAGAIRAFAFNEPDIIIETNLRRVFIHFFFPRRRKVTDAVIRRYIERTLDRKNPREWYWALMDYGAMLGETIANPNRRSAHYVQPLKFAGSDREIRGKILRLLLAKKRVSLIEFDHAFGKTGHRAKKILSDLSREGFLIKKSSFIRII